MLDGRVLGASQVEYKPFGKPPLQREVPGMQGFPALNSPHDLIQNCSMVDSCCRNIATNFEFAGRGQQETWVGDLRTTSLVVLRLRSRVQQVLEDFSAVSQTVRICKFSGDRQRNTPVADLRATLLEAPGRATCPASEPCQARAKVGILPRIFFFETVVQSDSFGEPARHRSLQPAEPAPRSGFFPAKKNVEVVV